MDAISCPYCNSVLSPDDVRDADGKARCPRCAEPLPSSLSERLASLTFSHAKPASEKAAWTNRAIGFAVLGVMVLMAIGGLTLALLTVETRRKNDYRVKKSDPSAYGHPGPRRTRGARFFAAGSQLCRRHAGGRACFMAIPMAKKLL